MKLLVQRVLQASVEVDNKEIGSIGSGVLVFIGVTHSDTPNQATWLANKLINLRIFEDQQGKINLSLLERQGAALVISQFTLYADCNGGRRPSFTQAGPPEVANPLYELFVDELRRGGITVATGIFGAYMKVLLINDGPFTLLLERN